MATFINQISHYARRQTQLPAIVFAARSQMVLQIKAKCDGEERKPWLSPGLLNFTKTDELFMSHRIVIIASGRTTPPARFLCRVAGHEVRWKKSLKKLSGLDIAWGFISDWKNSLLLVRRGFWAINCNCSAAPYFFYSF